MNRILPALLLVFGLGCGDDGGDGPSPDARPPADARIGADSNEVLPDGGATTECGSGELMETCDLATEICVITDLGGGLTYACESVPIGCDSQRLCATCAALCDEACDDVLQENTISCPCLSC